MKVRGLLPPVGIFTRPREGHMCSNSKVKCKPNETLYARFGLALSLQGRTLWFKGGELETLREVKVHEE